MVVNLHNYVSIHPQLLALIHTRKCKHSTSDTKTYVCSQNPKEGNFDIFHCTTPCVDM